jgi:hypothetical protein
LHDALEVGRVVGIGAARAGAVHALDVEGADQAVDDAGAVGVGL